MIRTCPSCGGSGDIETGGREHDTGYPFTAACGACNGEGKLPVLPEEDEMEQARRPR